MTFTEKLSEAIGQPLKVMWERDLQAMVGCSDRKDFQRRCDRFTKEIDLRELLEGEVSVSGPVLLIASHARGGIFLRVLELRSKNKA